MPGYCFTTSGITAACIFNQDFYSLVLWLPPAHRVTLIRCGTSSWPEVCRPKVVRKMSEAFQHKPIFTSMESLLFFSRLLVVNIGLKQKPEALII